MATTPTSARTPYYVLRDWDGSIGPKVAQLHTGIECSAIYGFSDKVPYDEFCHNSKLELKPYPLVKGYLRNQINALGDHLQLVVIDAAGPNEPNLQAATLETVLEAQESQTTHLETAFQLSLDQGTDAYRVQEVPE